MAVVAHLVALAFFVVGLGRLAPRSVRRTARLILFVVVLVAPGAFADGYRELLERRLTRVVAMASRLPSEAIVGLLEAVVDAAGVPADSTTTTSQPAPSP